MSPTPEDQWSLCSYTVRTTSALLAESENFDPEHFTKANEKLRTPLTYLPFVSADLRPSIEACPNGHYATEARNPHDLHRGNRT